jgi:hypothetical protein
MIERLKMLSPPVRYAVYVAGVILSFFVALGLGATAAAVVDWELGQATTGGTGRAATEPTGTTMLESTAEMPEETAREPSAGSSDGDDGVGETAFIHRATDENSRGDYTSITDSNIDGDPHAIVLVTPDTKREADGAASYGHNIGVWYTPVSHKWAIFNQDLAAVPTGSTFEVALAPAADGFVHRADPSNTSSSYTYLDNRRTNGKPDVMLTVTQNWNPGGGNGIYNDHPVGAIYDPQVEKWAIYNRDGARMPEGAAFNIALSASLGKPATR